MPLARGPSPPGPLSADGPAAAGPRLGSRGRYASGRPPAPVPAALRGFVVVGPSGRRPPVPFAVVPVALRPFGPSAGSGPLSAPCARAPAAARLPPALSAASAPCRGARGGGGRWRSLCGFCRRRVRPALALLVCVLGCAQALQLHSPRVQLPFS